MHAKRTKQNGRPEKAWQLHLPGLLLVLPFSLVLSLGISACQNVATYTQPTLVRVIDASYLAPTSNFTVEGQLLAASVGSGSITPYGTFQANGAAPITMTAASGGAALVTSNAALLSGDQYSIFVTDTTAAPVVTTMTVLTDQQTQAASNHSAFRFLNQAPKTGAVDVYMVPAGATLADSVPLVTALPVGLSPFYVNFTSQSVTMVITPTGNIKLAYTSAPITLVGSEARTVLIMDNKLTSNPPVAVTMVDDAGPAN